MDKSVRIRFLHGDILEAKIPDDTFRRGKPTIFYAIVDNKKTVINMDNVLYVRDIYES